MELILSYRVNFKVILKDCEPFTSIYSEVNKFCKQLVKDNLIESYKITYE